MMWSCDQVLANEVEAACVGVFLESLLKRNMHYFPLYPNLCIDV